VVVTDARYYGSLSRNVFRFLPLRLPSRDLECMHGIDERSMFTKRPSERIDSSLSKQQEVEPSPQSMPLWRLLPC
jgi:hypothetical protein